jgi:bleomycin hydrolase
MFNRVMSVFLILGTFLFSVSTFAQVYPQEVTVIREINTTPVKNQGNTGTCWDFATLSFLETELLKSTGKEYDLSEMFIVRNTYPDKAAYYVRLHGQKSFSQGGQAHDAINAIGKYGIVPQEVYPGMPAGGTKYDHSLLEVKLKDKVDWALKTMEKTRCTVYLYDVNKILDSNMGQLPQNFQYNGKTYTPLQFAQELKFDPSNYIELTSYKHHPFYSRFMLEVPDNWSNDMYYNVPIDDLITIMEYALTNGYTIDWDGDVSEPGFNQKNGFAVLTDETVTVTQDDRQLEFETWLATDDHLMHINGLAKDKDGNKYFKTKNSWGITGKYDGFIYISEKYMRLKTIAIMINKQALPADIAKKLGIDTK